MAYIIILIMVIANIVVFKFNVNSTYLLLALSVCVGTYKGVISEKVNDIFNIHPFIFKLNSKDNILELVAALLMSIIAFNEDIIAHQFGLLDLFMLSIFTLLIYRFLFYSLSKKNNKVNHTMGKANIN